MKAQLDSSVNEPKPKPNYKEALKKIPNATETPEPEVEILDFSPMRPILAVLPFCRNGCYRQVYFDTNRAIVKVCGGSGYPQPQHHFKIHNA